MLTDLACKSTISSARESKKTIKKFDRQGLYLEARPNGKAYWNYKYRIRGKELKISFGPYPLISLAEAREKHFAAYKQVKEGIDPSQKRQQEAVQAKFDTANTFKHWAVAWLDHNINQWSDNHYQTIKRRLEKDLLPGVGHLPIKDITRKRLLEELKKIEARGSLEIAHRSLGYAHNIFQYAINEEYLTKNVADNLSGSLQPKRVGYFPSMPLEELPNFLRKLERNEAQLSLDTREAMEALMHTLVRTKELIGIKYSEVFLDQARLIIPGTRMKRKKGCPIPQDHVVPLSRQMVKLFAERKRRNETLEPHLQSQYVFPSEKGPHKHMSNGTIGKALFRMGYRGIHTGHGFRALGMGIAKEKLGYYHDIIDRQLGHVSNDELKRSYDRALYLSQRIEMMQRVSDYIDSQKPNARSTVRMQNAISYSYETHPQYHVFYGKKDEYVIHC
ncbi:MAG: integrase arm-type DNA-binding domain-containing protein [Chitinophagales bacterium]|nr:integrase arm-type DNA-binding domain-containing protein [Chitinophagales bacterium]